jgi:hypothetical protein
MVVLAACSGSPWPIDVGGERPSGYVSAFCFSCLPCWDTPYSCLKWKLDVIDITVDGNWLGRSNAHRLTDRVAVGLAVRVDGYFCSRRWLARCLMLVSNTGPPMAVLGGVVGGGPEGPPPTQTPPCGVWWVLVRGKKWCFPTRKQHVSIPSWSLLRSIFGLDSPSSGQFLALMVTDSVSADLSTWRVHGVR